MTDDFRQAVEYAQWWTRKAIDLAPDADPHPGIVGHLTAAQSQHWAIEQLMKTSGREAA